MREGELILLISKNASYLTEIRKGRLNTKDGIFDLDGLAKKKFGGETKTHLGKKFTIIRPTINDILEKKIRRSAQVVLPKDIALILAYTGISPDGLVVDCGTGTGYLSIFLANYVNRGKVITYEKDKNFAKIARENIKSSGLKNIKLKQKDVTRGIEEKGVDLVTVDIQTPEKVVKHAYKALRRGGWLAVYSPTVEEVIAVSKEIRKLNFSYIKTVENIVREWQTESTTRPKTMGIMHTGFLTFARKVC